jgi:hypothetical protein
VHFNNSAWMNDSVNHSTPVTVFYVSRQTGGANARVLGAQNNWLLGYHDGQRNRCYFDGWVYDAGTASDTNPHLFAATIPGIGQNSTVWGDGTQLASNQTGVSGPNNLQLNGYTNSANELSDCDISEVLVYNRILTPGELISVGNYLAGKYNLTTAYPSPTSMANVLFPGLGYAHPIDGTPTGFQLQVPVGTSVNPLSPTYEILEGASGSPASGEPLNFSTPQTYRITAQDASWQDYTVAVVPYTGYGAKVMASGPLAYWPLNEGKGLVAYDNSSGNNGAYSSSGVTYGVAGPVGENAVRFNGAAGVAMEIPQAAALSPDGPFSVEMWAMPAAVPPAPSPQYVASNCKISSPREGWYLAQDAGGTFNVGNAFVVRMFNRNGTTPACQLYAPIDTVRWYHLVLTWDGTTAKLYADGVSNETNQFGTATLASYFGNTTSPYTVGKRSDGALPWAGSAAQMAFYTRALTPQEIQDHYQSTGGSYGAWASANGIPGEPASGDFDNDGLTNLMEYALGKDPTVSSQPAGVLIGKVITFTKGADAIANGDVSWVIEESSDLGLADPWAPAVTQPAGDPALTISYTLPAGAGKVFARLKVTQP